TCVEWRQRAISEGLLRAQCPRCCHTRRAPLLCVSPHEIPTAAPRPPPLCGVSKVDPHAARAITRREDCAHRRPSLSSRSRWMSDRSSPSPILTLRLVPSRAPAPTPLLSSLSLLLRSKWIVLPSPPTPLPESRRRVWATPSFSGRPLYRLVSVGGRSNTGAAPQQPTCDRRLVSYACPLPMPVAPGTHRRLTLPMLCGIP
ncbi:hypothetical protein B0H16DRAFT_1535966, partial [Mycena metata]